MYRSPIEPTAHGIINFAFATFNTLASALFRLEGPAKANCYEFAATQGTLNYMLTDYNAYEPERSRPGGQELAETAVAEFA